MRALTSNFGEAIGFENTEWLAAWPEIEKHSEKVATSTGNPRVLVIDDDPLFCKRMIQEGRKKKIDVTTCKTLGDVTSLPAKLPFDAAIVDYFFGDELTAVQLVHLIGEDVPVILVSNTEQSKLPKEPCPSYRNFVHKSYGTERILAEAVFNTHFPYAFPQIQPIPTKIERKDGEKGKGFRINRSTLFWLLMGLVGVITFGRVAFMLMSTTTGPMKPIRWDQIQVEKTTGFSQNDSRTVWM